MRRAALTSSLRRRTLAPKRMIVSTPIMAGQCDVLCSDPPPGGGPTSRGPDHPVDAPRPIH